METEKMSKSKQKKLEAQNKRSFTQRVFSMTLQAIPPAVEDTTEKIQIRISGKNHNRYICFSSYGQSCSILIYKDGNVEVELNEAFHNKFKVQVFAFTPDEAAQREFENHFKEVLGWLIPVFLETLGYDFHTFMDFVSDEQDLDKAYVLAEIACGNLPETEARKECEN